jgi:fumarate hydratase class II
MMPIIAHNLFESMQVMIGSVNAFTENCVRGLQANRPRAEAWLEKNAILVTALNPLIGYAAGAKLVKEALAGDVTVRQLAISKAAAGELRHRDEDRSVSAAEVEAALNDLRRLTEGGIAGG